MKRSILIAALASSKKHRIAVSSMSALAINAAYNNGVFRRSFEGLLSNKKETLILDGGTGEELFRRGVPDDRKIWSATAIVNEKYHPVLREVHRSFIEAGSDVITTNSYGITPGVGFSHDEIVKYVAIAGQIARDSASLQGEETPSSRRHPTMVCGSLGPLVESYRPDKIMEHSNGVATYAVMAKALFPNVDCYLAETMSSFEESSQAVEAVGKLSAAFQLPMMVSYTLRSDGSIRSGEPVVKCIRRLIEFAVKNKVQLVGVMFNCAEPESITSALRQIHADLQLRKLLDDNGIILGAYSNRLTPVPENWSLEGSSEAQAMRKDVSPQDYYERFVSNWVENLGVQMVGGCCGITPGHIEYISLQMREKQEAE